MTPWTQRFGSSGFDHGERFFVPTSAERVRTGHRCRLELDRRPQLAPRLVEAREPQIALRREVAVDDRLGDAGRARDLGGRRARVAARAEHLERAATIADRRSAAGSRACAASAHAASGAPRARPARCERAWLRTVTSAVDGAAERDHGGDVERVVQAVHERVDPASRRRRGRSSSRSRGSLPSPRSRARRRPVGTC